MDYGSIWQCECGQEWKLIWDWCQDGWSRVYYAEDRPCSNSGVSSHDRDTRLHRALREASARAERYPQAQATRRLLKCLIELLQYRLAELTASAGDVPTVHARVGDRVEVILVGELTDYDEESGVWTLRGHSVEGHVDWEYSLHWGTRFRLLGRR